MKDLKKIADELVESFAKIERYELSNENILQAIQSVNHTISVLEKENDINYCTLEHIIAEQLELKKILEGRL
jgi:phosphosulfolactate phosphohydrolase-like enzyme